jgi:hypothetical protein
MTYEVLTPKFFELTDPSFRGQKYRIIYYNRIYDKRDTVSRCGDYCWLVLEKSSVRFLGEG